MVVEMETLAADSIPLEDADMVLLERMFSLLLSLMASLASVTVCHYTKCQLSHIVVTDRSVTDGLVTQSYGVQKKRVGSMKHSI